MAPDQVNDFYTYLMWGRFIEKYMTILIAGICIYLGYRLFYISETATAELEADGAWGKIKLAKAAPGIFFTLFGCLLLGYGLSKSPRVQAETQPINGTSKAGGASANASRTNIEFGGLSATSGKVEFDTRTCARGTYFALNEIRSSEPFTKSQGPLRQQYDEGLRDLEGILRGCIDARLGSGAYGRYDTVEKQMQGGNVDASPESVTIHQKVSDLLAN